MKKFSSGLSSLKKMLIAGVVVGVAGCATTGPDYEKPQMTNPDAWRVSYDTASSATNTAWWTQFSDPTLTDLIETALRENQDVRIAAARVEAFAASVDVSRSALFPQVGYGANGSRNQASREEFNGVSSGDRTYSDYQTNVNVNWELDLWGRISRANEAARANLLAQEENRRAIILSLVSAVAATYVNLSQLDGQLVYANETLASRAESLKLFELKFKGGLVSDLEVAQVQSEYEQAATAIPPIERDIAITENALSILLGRYPGPITRGKTIARIELPSVPSDVPSEVLARRPDILSAEQQLVAANARIGVARAQYFPAISLTGLLGYASDDLNNLIGGSSNVWNLGGNALGAIFAGGRIDAQIRATEAQKKAALHTYVSAVQNAFREVDDALVSNQKSRDLLAAQKRRVDALANYAGLAKKRYDEGYSSYMEVLDAQRFLFNQQLKYVEVQGEVLTSLISVYKSMGGGWVSTAQAIADPVDFSESKDDQQKIYLDYPKQTQPRLLSKPKPTAKAEPTAQSE